jgi:hypothetical protein
MNRLQVIASLMLAIFITSRTHPWIPWIGFQSGNARDVVPLYRTAVTDRQGRPETSVREIISLCFK